MKKSTIFIFAYIFLLIINSGLSQAFFIPEYETRPRYEQLPNRKPIAPKNAQRNLNQFNQEYEVEKYIMVNGVFSPVYKKKEKPAPIPAKTIDYNQDHPQVIKIAQPKPKNEPKVKQEEMKMVEIDQIQPIEEDNTFPEELGFTPINPSLPKYKNIYSQYLLDTKVFKRTGKFPQNKNLEESLAKMSNGEKKILYSGNLKLK